MMTLKIRQLVEERLARWSFTVHKVEAVDVRGDMTATFRTVFASPTNWAGTMAQVDWQLDEMDHRVSVLSVAPVIDDKRLLDSVLCGKDDSADLRRALKGAWEELRDLRF